MRGVVDTVNVEATRDILVRAGVHLIDHDGIDAVGVRSVAAAAGLSHGAPRRYFPSLSALLAAIAREGIADLDRELTPALRHGLTDAAAVYFRFSRARPHMFALIFRHDVLAGAGQDLRALTGPWLAAVTDTAGSERRAVEAWAAVHGLCVLAQTNAGEAVGVRIDEELVREVVAGITESR